VEIERLLFRNFMWRLFYIFTPAQSTETISVNEAEQVSTMGSGLRVLVVVGGALDAAGLRNGLGVGKPACQ
jgi:hypothetical protein